MPRIVQSSQFKVAFAAEMRSRLQQAGDHLVNELQDRLSEPYPPSSIEGEYPHMRTGTLLSSVYADLDEADLSVTVKASAPYAEDLTIMRRKLTSDVLDEERDVIDLIMSGR